MARKFFYICAGMFMLGLSYHFGASRLGAQVGLTIDRCPAHSGTSVSRLGFGGLGITRLLRWLLARAYPPPTWASLGVPGAELCRV